eukprot:4248945-Amphidinium_carterae.1
MSRRAGCTHLLSQIAAKFRGPAVDVEVRRSSIDGAGSGVFVIPRKDGSSDFIPSGSLVAIYPGTFFPLPPAHAIASASVK